MSVIDLALWDLAGRVIGCRCTSCSAARDRVKAYASSVNSLGRPEDYAAHAVDCQRDQHRLPAAQIEPVAPSHPR